MKSNFEHSGILRVRRIIPWNHWLILIFCLCFTAYAWQSSLTQIENRRLSEFDNEVERLTETLIERMGTYSEALSSGVALFEASENVTYDEWSEYASSIDIHHRYPGVTGIGFIDYVTEEKLPGFLVEQQALRPDFRIHPSRTAREYFPVTYLTSTDKNEHLIGLDIAHEQTRYLAAKKARDGGETQITGPLILSDGGRETSGFLFYAPLYTPRENTTLKERRENFDGLVFAPIIVSEIMSGSIARDVRKILFRLSDNDKVFYDEFIEQDPGSNSQPLFKRTETIELYGRFWKIEIWSGEDIVDSGYLEEPLIILFSGLILTGLLFWVFYLYTRSTRDSLEYTRTLEGVLKEKDLAEKTQQKSDARFKGLFEQAVDTFITIDTSGKMLSHNKAALSVFGYHSSEMIGRNFSMLMTSPFREQHNSTIERYLQTGDKHLIGRPQEVEAITKKGRHFPIELTISELNLNGEREFIGVIRDISQRKNSERLSNRLKTALDQTLDCIFMFEEDSLRFTYCNDGACEQIGFNETEILKMTPVDINPEFDRSKFLAILKPLVSGDSQVLQFESIHQHKDGHNIPVEVSLQLIHDESKPAQFIVVVRDITKRQQVLDELNAAIVTANQASDAKSLFLANTSHEIRTPLNGLVGAVELLANSDLTESQRRHLELARISSKNLLGIINDILDMSKIEAGHMELDEEEFEFRKIIESVVELNGANAHEKGLALGIQFDHTLPKFVTGDSEKLQQVVRNLLSNAIKFTSIGSVLMRISRVENNLVFFSIKDRGIGISEEQQKKLFQPFAQAEASTTRKFGGTGLGLALSKQIVKLMGGEIGFKSQLGEGSEFWFKVPLIFGEEKSDEENIRLSATKLRVLVIDEDASHAQLLSEQIASWGMRSSRTKSPESALTKITKALEQKDPYRVIVIDINFPKDVLMPFLEAVSERIEIKDSAVVVMFASTDTVDTDILESAGVTGFIQKPVRQSTLYDEMMNAIARAKNFHSKKGSSSESTVAQTSQLLQGKNVLLVEDNEINQIVATEMLGLLGCNCHVAPNGLVAIQKFKTENFDLIFMDCQMPEMDGFDATREIRRQERELKTIPVPIIALTANAVKGDKEKCLEAGMDEYISKPVDLQKLAEVVLRMFLKDRSASLTKSLKNPKETLEYLPIDVDAMLNRCMNNYQIVSAILEKFLEHAEKDLEILESAVIAGDSQKIFEIAHAIKGAARMISAERVCEKAMILELMGRSGVLQDQQQHFANLKQEVLLCINFMPEATQALLLLEVNASKTGEKRL